MNLEIVKRVAQGPASKGVLLFVPGACHGAWCWEEHYLDWFSERGWTSYAMSFRGHGNSEGREHLDEYGIDDYVEDVAQVLKFIAHQEAGSPAPIVVAHSLGGGVMERLIGQGSDAAGGVVLLASMPIKGAPMSYQMKLLFKHSKGTRVMLNINAGKSVTPEQLRDAVVFGGRISLEDAARFAKLVQPESKRITKEQAHPFTDTSDVSVPVRVVGSRGDWMFPDQGENASAYRTEPVMVEGLCHDMMLDPEWEVGAKAVLGAIEDLGKTHAVATV